LAIYRSIARARAAISGGFLSGRNSLAAKIFRQIKYPLVGLPRTVGLLPLSRCGGSSSARV